MVLVFMATCGLHEGHASLSLKGEPFATWPQ